VITLAADTFLALLAGRTDVTSANMTGQVRLEGAGEASMLLGGMVSTFRAEAARAGVRGVVTRGLSRLFAQGGRA
jgi:putative sterol carrier protein